jgi:hypothetical protein
MRRQTSFATAAVSCYFWLFYPFFISLTIHQREKQWIRGFVFLGLGFKVHHLDFLALLKGTSFGTHAGAEELLLELRRLLAMGMITYNIDWLAIQQRFLPSKSVHQVPPSFNIITS